MQNSFYNEEFDKNHFLLANTIRALSIDSIERASSGHHGLPLGMANVFTTLYTKFLKFYPPDPQWPARDRLILSAGHGSMLLYATLYLLGYKNISLEALKNFRQLSSSAAGHPEYDLDAGIEMTTGPLGQGVSAAVGIALAERILSARLQNPIIDHYTYVLAGDGCLMEGVSYESLSFAGHWKLSKLIVFWDDNQITIDGKTDLVTSENMLDRFRAAGWSTHSLDAYNPESISSAIEEAQKSEKPSLISCKTVIGYGSPNIAGTSKAHGGPFGEKEARSIKEKLGIHYPAFTVPKNLLDLWRHAGIRHQESYHQWNQNFENLEETQKKSVNQFLSRIFLQNIFDHLTSFKKEVIKQNKNISTRKASLKVIEQLLPLCDKILGGSADLSDSNQTKPNIAPLSKSYQGQYIHYGIREHAMAAIMNGLSLYGFFPYGGTFLCFSDYMRPAMRVAALMKIPVLYILTHDSIALGEDGPTHQPVEHLASFRAMPNMWVFRPADIVETIECWQLALKRSDGPSILALTRQNLPLVRSDFSEKNLCAQGAYIIKEAYNDLRICLWASGSEVSLALQVQKILESRNIGTRLISIPCFELFFQQPKKQIATLTDNNLYHVAIEAGVKQGWYEIIGKEGLFCGLSTFGKSAPAKDLFDYFELNPEDIVAKILKHHK